VPTPEDSLINVLLQQPKASRNSPGDKLSFVNRHAEALDVWWMNLKNADEVDDVQLKPWIPVAPQAVGTGKTMLGVHLTAPLARRRGTRAEEEAIAMRLREGSFFVSKNEQVLARALNTPGNDCLIVRVLKERFPALSRELDELKTTQPIVVALGAVSLPVSMQSLERALAFAVLCAGFRVHVTFSAIAAASKLPALNLQLAVRMLTKELGHPPVLVFDEVEALNKPEYEPLFHAAQAGPERSLRVLFQALATLVKSERCYVYATGRSMWLSHGAQVSTPTSPVFHPVFLQPLTAEDVAEALESTPAVNGHGLLRDALGIDYHVLPRFIKRLMAVTGGSGRMVQTVLRLREGQCVPALLSGATDHDIEEALTRLQHLLPSNVKSIAPIEWDGPARFSADSQQWHSMLLSVAIKSALLDTQINIAKTVFGTRLANSLAYAGYMVRSRSSEWGKLVIGEWQAQALAHSAAAAEPYTYGTSTGWLLDMLLRLRGSMAGRPFELLTADALLHKFAAAALVRGGRQDGVAYGGTVLSGAPGGGRSVAELFPALSGTRVGGAPAAPLRIVSVPKVTSKSQQLTAAVKQDYMLRVKTSSQWPGPPTMHPADLEWLLTAWLPEYSLAIPAYAESGSCDLFIRFHGDMVVGLSVKAYTAGNSLTWGGIQSEIDKAPHGLRMVLVVWSTVLADPVHAKLAGRPHVLLEAGKDAIPVNLPAGIQLVIVNPNHMDQLFGQHVHAKVQTWVSDRKDFAEAAVDTDDVMPFLAAGFNGRRR